MKTIFSKILAIMAIAIAVTAACAPATLAYAAGDDTSAEQEVKEDDPITGKAYAAAIAIGAAAFGGAIAMGISIAKTSESIARQPEAGGQVRTSMMLGLVFIETAIIYALIVAILIIFVL